jgi:hypothetical protein
MSDDPIEKATYNTFKKVTLDTTLGKLNRILDSEHFALVVHSQRLCELSFFNLSSSEFILSITPKSK